MSFAAILRGGPSAADDGARLPAKRQYKYSKRVVEASLEHGERAATFLQSVYGQEQAALIFNKCVERSNGSQPSFEDDHVIVDSDDSAPSQAAADKRGCIPYGFWRRFMVEELQIQPSNAKRMQLLRSLKFFCSAKKKEQALCGPCAACEPEILVEAVGVLSTLLRQQAYASRCCSSSWTMCSD